MGDVVTPIYGWPYQSLLHPPDGAMLGEEGFNAVEETVASIDARLNLAEDTLLPAAAGVSNLESAWVDWVPIHTNLTVGAGATIVARAKVTGKTGSYFWMVTLGAAPVVGTLPSFTLPFTPHPSYVNLTQIGMGELFDTGLASYLAMGRWTTTDVALVYPGVNGIHTAVGAVSPFVWVAGDRLFVHGENIELA